MIETESPVLARSGSAGSRPLKTKPRKSRSERLAGYLFALPTVILVAGIVHYGIVANVVFSTWDWNGISPQHDFVGADNYLAMMSDPVFWQSLANTFTFAVLAVGVQLILGFLLAVLVRTRTVGTSLLRVMLFVPVVLSGAVVATCFREILRPDGAFNAVLGAVGIAEADQPWLADPATALLAITAINIWQYTGYSFVIYDAALGQVDNSIVEAARMDGASTVQLMTRVLFPLLKGSHLILIVLGFIGSLKTFELVYLTTGGGPGTSTEFLSTYIYRLGIPQFNASYSATLSIGLVIMALTFAALQIRLTRQREKH